MTISVIVPIAGDLDRAWQCFISLAALDESPAHEIIVVDDSAPGLEHLLERLAGDVRSVRTGSRGGFAAAANAGSRAAEGDMLVFLRDAGRVAPPWLGALAAELDRPGTVAATSATLGPTSTHPSESLAVALRRSDFDRVGGFAPVGDQVAIAALCADLAPAGTVGTVGGSVVDPAPWQPGPPRHDPATRPELSIVIPTLHGAGDRVRRCLRAIAATTPETHEVIVMDNGSSPQGFTAPVNAGLRAANGRHLVVMNDDVEPLPGWWPPLRAGLEAGAAVTFPHTIEGAMRTDFAAWCFALSRSALRQFEVHPGEFFDPRFSVWFQDTDLLLRLRQAGCPPVLVPASKIRHGLSQTVHTTQPELARWIRAEIARDERRFFAKYPGAHVSQRAS